VRQTHGGGNKPMFINRNADASVVISEVNYSDTPYLQLVITETEERERRWVEPDTGFRGFRLVSFEARAGTDRTGD